MVQTQIKIAVVSHISRKNMAMVLADKTAADFIVLDYEGRGALASHRDALQWASEQDKRCVIMEDDALPVPDFISQAGRWLERFPDDLVSFYLGTGRPPQWQPRIALEMLKVGREKCDYIALEELLHAVCYSIPAGMVKDVLDGLPDKPADYAIGHAWRHLTGRSVIYPGHSLVDHANVHSVERHSDGCLRSGIRRAWRMHNSDKNH